MPIADWLILAFWVGFQLYWLIAARRAKKSVRRGPWWRAPAARAAFLKAPAVVLGLLLWRHWLPAAARHLPPGPVRAGIGLALCAAGLGLAVWARVHLGRNWGVPMSLRVEPELVTGGPYAVVRHPIYTGLIVALIGTALTISLVWLLPFAVIVGYFLYSARVEDRLMAQQFPDRHPAYKKRTRMLIPFLL